MTYVFQAVKVLVTLAAGFTAERLLLLHAQRSRIRSTGLRVDDGKGTVSILVQLLCLVTMCLVVPAILLVCRLAGGETPPLSSPIVRGNLLEAVLILVCLFATNYRALEGLVLLRHHHALQALHEKLVGSWVVQLSLVETQLSQLRLDCAVGGREGAVGAKQMLAGVVDAEVGVVVVLVATKAHIANIVRATAHGHPREILVQIHLLAPDHLSLCGE